MSEQRRIPKTVTHDEFKAAIEPLLDLLNVTDTQVYNDIHITQTGADSTHLAVISMTVVARKAGDDSEYPEGVSLADAPQEYAELGYFVTTEVV